MLITQQQASSLYNRLRVHRTRKVTDKKTARNARQRVKRCLAKEKRESAINDEVMFRATTLIGEAPLSKRCRRFLLVLIWDWVMLDEGPPIDRKQTIEQILTGLFINVTVADLRQYYRCGIPTAKQIVKWTAHGN